MPSDPEQDYTDPVVTHVFSGIGAAVEPSSVFAETDNDDVSVTFDLEVPVGGRAILMHFAAQSPDRISANAQAASLHALPDAALFGLSAGQKADIINFSTP